MTDKITAYQVIEMTVQSVCENPKIPSKDRRKEIATILEPMMNEIFGTDYEIDEGVKNDR
mgnify:FL=1